MKKLAEIAEYLKGKIVGDESILISGVNTLQEAKEGEITFLANPKYESEVKKTHASAIIVSDKVQVADRTLVQVPNPYLGFAKVIELFYANDPRKVRGVDSRAFIEPSAELGRDVNIYPFAYVGERVKIGDFVDIYPYSFIGDDAVVGEKTVIFPNVSIYPRTIIGKNVRIHSGTVIGSDGFGYATDGGIHHKIHHVGRVVIGDDVEIGAGTTIDKAVLEETVIGEGSKLDNQVQIAHNVKTGRGCLLVSQVGVSGSSTLGDYVTLAGQAGIVGHIHIGDRTIVGAQSGVTKSVGPDQIVAGTPSAPITKAKRAANALLNLPELRNRITRLEKALAELENKLKQNE